MDFTAVKRPHPFARGAISSHLKIVALAQSLRPQPVFCSSLDTYFEITKTTRGVSPQIDSFAAW